ncbi:MAG: 5-(carboxyamino)imidazole ribonucleotide mutase [Gammaproteobacteria bacterium]|nr:5-(carboxyamino)imidazole ribonucleotide mutase [Gammaproteobacteria bacterium]
MSDTFVAIIMGSDSDLPTMQGTIEILKKFNISFEVKISSAHRTPARTHAYVTDAEARGCSIFICAAGLAAHLAGSVAGLTAKPVIGVPMDGGPLNGQDALLSTVQMPGGIPVACVAIGKAGAKNAGYLAAQMLSISDKELAQRLIDERAENAKLIEEKDNELQKQFA